MNENRVLDEKRPVSERVNDFNEVSLGYTPEQAKLEASRCLKCKTRPCVAGCPMNNSIPEFLSLVSRGEFEKAYGVIRNTNCMPSITGRVCQQEIQCEKNCTRGIKGESVSIGKIERFVADYHANAVNVGDKDTYAFLLKESKGKVAVVGSGPSGLACADRLLTLGYSVTVFEAQSVAGGILYYGIPEFCLPKYIVKRDIDLLKSKGADVVTDTVIGKTLTVDELINSLGYDAVFLGGGANKPQFLDIDGEHLKGVISANEYLYAVNTEREDSFRERLKANKVVVIGGGNVAIDACRSVLRISKDVTVLYRRTLNELPARKEEVDNALQEGVKFEFLTAPVRILGDGENVTGVECVKMKLGEPDQSGRSRPIVIKDSNFVVNADKVILAIGAEYNPLANPLDGKTEKTSKGFVFVDGDGFTGIDGVFAGGDLTTGASTVILSARQGVDSANAIDKYIQNKKVV